MSSEVHTRQGRREASAHRATIAKPRLAVSDLASGALGVAEAHKARAVARAVRDASHGVTLRPTASGASHA
jgi:hypothetical protein